MSVSENSITTVKRVVDNTEAFGAILADNQNSPIDLTGVTITARLVDLEDGTEIVTGAACTEHPTVVYTVATTDVFTSVKHGLRNGQEIILTTTSVVPAGLALLTRYFVRDATDDIFKVSATRNGTAVDVTDTGTGTQTFARVGHVTWAPASGDVDTAGLYGLYFVDDSSPVRKWPFDGAKYRIKIIEETEEVS